MFDSKFAHPKFEHLLKNNFPRKEWRNRELRYKIPKAPIPRARLLIGGIPQGSANTFQPRQLYRNRAQSASPGCKTAPYTLLSHVHARPSPLGQGLETKYLGS